MLVNCFAYQDGKRIAEQITPTDIVRYIGRPECFVWVALKDPAHGEFAQLEEQFGLHELAIEDASVGHQRPKIEEYGDSLFAVLHVIEIVNDELVVGEVDIFAGPNYILSVRNRAEKGFVEVRARCEREPDLLREMVTTALSVNLSLITVAENETTNRLAACAALVAVPTLVAGIYGMNFQHMPELRWEYGYPMALAFMAVVDTYLFVRFRRAGWL